MATPKMQIQSLFATLPISTGAVTRINFVAKDLTGTAINVSSGYTVENILVAGTNRYNAGASTDIESAQTASFDSSGNVNMDFDSTLAGILVEKSGSIEVYLSNDGGTTKVVAAAGQYTAQNIL